MIATQATTPRQPDYRLFNSTTVGVIAFLFSPLAGAMLIAINYRRLGEARKSALTIAAGLVATVLAILIKWSLGKSLADLVFELLYFLAAWLLTWRFAKEEQGRALQAHLARGGKLGTEGTALLVGIATSGLLFLAAIAALLLIRIV
jgi:hypothetical protein